MPLVSRSKLCPVPQLLGRSRRPQTCQHTRYFDKDPSPKDRVGFLTHGVCLDCGATITLGKWELTRTRTCPTSTGQ
jgi:hypothetical protein